MKLTEEEKETLANENFRYIHYFTKKYHTPQWDYDDILGAATLGMTSALNTFDKDKGIKFSTYSARCITNAIFMFMRREKKHLYNVSIDQPVTSDEKGNDLSILDLLKSAEKEIDWREISPVVNKVIFGLSERNRNIMRMFFENKSQKEIGDAFGLSQSYIARIVGRVLQDIKKAYWRGDEDMPKITAAEYIKLSNNGLTDDEIARSINTTKNYLGSLKRKWGLNTPQRSVEKKKTPAYQDTKEADYSQMIAELKSELQDRDTYIQSRENLIDTLENRVSESQAELSNIKASYADIDNEMASIKKENSELRKENQALRFLASRYLAG
jgi:RNA polymerase sporulation-specific sigma factor